MFLSETNTKTNVLLLEGEGPFTRDVGPVREDFLYGVHFCKPQVTVTREDRINGEHKQFLCLSLKDFGIHMTPRVTIQYEGLKSSRSITVRISFVFLDNVYS